MIKAGFYLMGKKGLSCLEAIIDFGRSHAAEFSVAYVVCAKDKDIANDYYEEIQRLAIQNIIPFYDRTTTAEFSEADLFFAISWRWLIKENIEKLVVFHDSILPKYRGFNPLVTALIEGDEEIGVTAIRANREFDKGNIIGVEKVRISHPIKIEDAIEKISLQYRTLLVKTIQNKIDGKLIETIQDESAATYSLWRDDEDYHIDWSQSGDKILRFINAVGFPYNGAFCFVDGKKIIIQEAELSEDCQIVNRIPGKLLLIRDHEATVVCGSGLLKITSALDENGDKMRFTKLRIRLK